MGEYPSEKHLYQNSHKVYYPTPTLMKVYKTINNKYQTIFTRTRFLCFYAFFFIECTI